jgi:hypothetical protein
MDTDTILSLFTSAHHHRFLKPLAPLKLARATITMLNKFLYFALFLLVTSTWASTEDASHKLLNSYGNVYGYATTREEIIESRKRRKKQLRNMVHGMRKTLSNHGYGSITLPPEEKASLEYRMDIFQRKLDTMSDDVDDRVSIVLFNCEQQEELCTHFCHLTCPTCFSYCRRWKEF